MSGKFQSWVVFFTVVLSGIFFKSAPAQEYYPEPDKLVQCHAPNERRWNEKAYNISPDGVFHLNIDKGLKKAKIVMSLWIRQLLCKKQDDGTHRWIDSRFAARDLLYVNRYADYKDTAMDRVDIDDRDAVRDVTRSFDFHHQYIWLKGAYTAPFYNDGERTKIEMPLKDAITRKEFKAFLEGQDTSVSLVLGLSNTDIQQAYQWAGTPVGPRFISDTSLLSGTYRAELKITEKGRQLSAKIVQRLR
jgi:hypothetical protein